MVGKVISYNATKRFGYIRGDDGEEYFVHESEVKVPSKMLYCGYGVQFNIENGFPKKQAVNVRLM